MGYLFLDIETYVHPQNGQSAFNPYEKEAKVVVIGFNYYSGFRSPKREQLKQPTFLLEWESGEKEILKRFHAFLKKTFETDPQMKMVGYNILKFDIPYLFGRMDVQGIDTRKNLADLLFAKPFAVDLYQLSTVISEKTEIYGELWGISQKDANKFFSIRAKEGSGEEMGKWYDAKDFERILRYCAEEFTFEQLYDAFLLYALEKKNGKQ